MCTNVIFKVLLGIYFSARRFAKRNNKALSCAGETIYAYGKGSERTCCEEVSDAVGIWREIIGIWRNQENVYRELITMELER